MPSSRDFFILTVRYYPEAVEAGVEPVEPDGFPLERNPAHYRGHDFHFDKPPSRQDFLALCRGRIPWTHVWEDSLLPLIESKACPWPMLDCGKKASSADITDESGRKVGDLRLYRHHLYSYDGYDRNAIFIDSRDEDAVVKRLPKDRRTDANMLLMQGENRLQEHIASLQPCQLERVGVQKILRDFLVQHGVIKKKPKAKQTTEV